MPFLCVVVGALAETARRHVPAKSRHRAELAAEWSRLDNTFNRSLEAIARRARHSDTHDHSWFQWEPTWACPSDELVGEFGDGVKWVCGLRDLVATDEDIQADDEFFYLDDKGNMVVRGLEDL